MSDDQTNWLERGLERGLKSGMLWLVLCCYGSLHHSCATEQAARIEEAGRALAQAKKSLIEMDAQAEMIERTLDRQARIVP